MEYIEIDLGHQIYWSRSPLHPAALMLPRVTLTKRTSSGTGPPDLVISNEPCFPTNKR